MGLIGENGAGKSTTINAILDLIKKDEGTVRFWGQELVSSEQLKEDIGVVFDGINFYETLSPLKVGKICAAAYKQWDSSSYQKFIERFKLPEGKEIRTLSKGMKMKLSIAVALSHQPKLLILDEATSGLDPVMRDDIRSKYALVMPVQRKDIVAAKFIVLIIFCAVGVFFGLVFGMAGGLAMHKLVLDMESIMTLLFMGLAGMVVSVIFGSMSIPLVYKFGAEKGRMLLLISFIIPAAICFIIYEILTAVGMAITDQLVFIILCCSPFIALVWSYIMYRISYGIFRKQEIF